MKNIFIKYIKPFLPLEKVKVNLFILGAQKAGTTSLFEYLTHHPQINGSFRKEINFFSQPYNYNRGDVWYHSFFPKDIYNPFRKKYFLDATPGYLYDENTPKKLLKYNKQAKFIILLRNPVDRAYSAWNMYRQFNKLNNEQKKVLIETHLNGQSLDLINRFKKLIYSKQMPIFNVMINQGLLSIS